jgi:hypothetical protein
MARVKKNKKDKSNTPHFNAVDAMIVILLIVALVGIYFRYNIIDFLTADKNDEQYVVSFSIEDIKYTTPNYMSVGDKVYFKSSGELMGTLISESENQGALNITPALKYFTDSKGNIEPIFYPNEESRVDAKGRLLCLGNYTEKSGFCIDGNIYIASGQYVAVYTELVSFNLKITSIEPYEE